MTIRCVVAAINANGEPDLYFVKVSCTEDEYSQGLAYDAAMKSAEDNGYDPKLAYDENDAAGSAIMDAFVWRTADTVKVSTYLNE